MEGGLVMVQRFLEQGQCLLAALQLLLRRLLRGVEKRLGVRVRTRARVRVKVLTLTLILTLALT